MGLNFFSVDGGHHTAGPWLQYLCWNCVDLLRKQDFIVVIQLPDKNAIIPDKCECCEGENDGKATVDRNVLRYRNGYKLETVS